MPQRQLVAPMTLQALGPDWIRRSSNSLKKQAENLEIVNETTVEMWPL